MKVAAEMPYSVAIMAQVSPGTTTCHSEHPMTAPDAVGAGAETALAQVGTCRLLIDGAALGCKAMTIVPAVQVVVIVLCCRLTWARPAPDAEATVVSAV